VITVTFTDRHAHRALWVALLLGLTAVALDGIDGGMWTRVPFWALYLLAIVHLLGAYAHAAGATLCPHCQPPPAARLKRPHYRAWLWWGRWGGLSVGVLVVGSLLVDDATVPVASAWHPSVVPLAFVLVPAAYISARRLVTLALPESQATPLRDLVQRHAAGLLHKAYLVEIPGYLGNTVLVALHGHVPHEGTLAALGFAFVAVGGYLDFRHGTMLCTGCVQELHIDASAHAQRHGWCFTARHRLLKASIVLVAVVAASRFLPRPYDMVGALATLAYVLGATVVSRFHAMYQPWCPLCHGRGNGGEHEQAPDPAPTHGQPVPTA
jgi:hypothetical protein